MESVEEWVRGRYGDRVASLAPIAAGSMKPVFRVELTSGERLVAAGSGTTFASGEYLEPDVLRLGARAGVPTPTVVAVEREGRCAGRMLTTAVDAPTADRWMATADADRVCRFLRRAGRTLGETLSLGAWDRAGVFTRRGDQLVPHETIRWRDLLTSLVEHTADRAARLVGLTPDTLVARVREQLSEPPAGWFLHGDFSPDNVFVATDDDATNNATDDVTSDGNSSTDDATSDENGDDATNDSNGDSGTGDTVAAVIDWQEGWLSDVVFPYVDAEFQFCVHYRPDHVSEPRARAAFRDGFTTGAGSVLDRVPDSYRTDRLALLVWHVRKLTTGGAVPQVYRDQFDDPATGIARDIERLAAGATTPTVEATRPPFF